MAQYSQFSQQDKRLTSWVSFASFTLACLVVYIHSYNATPYGLQYHDSSRFLLWIEDIISQDIAHIAVPTFFAISGYLFYRTANWVNLKSKLKRRVNSLVVPYLVWNIIYLGIFSLITVFAPMGYQLSDDTNVEFSLRGIAAGVFFFKQNYIMWFIYQLIIYVALSPLLLFIYKNIWSSAALVIILGVLYSYGFHELPFLSKDTIAVGLMPNMFCYYSIGAILAMHQGVLEKLSNKKLAYLLIVVAQFCWLFNRVGYKVFRYNSLDFLFCFLSVLGVLLLMASKENRKSWGGQNCTFLVFAMHPIMLIVMQKVSLIVLPHNLLIASFAYFIYPVVIILFIYYADRLISKVPRIHQVLTGGR